MTSTLVGPKNILGEEFNLHCAWELTSTLMIGILFIFPFQLIAGIIKIDFLTLPVPTSADKATGLVETLISKGPFTLFAPNESAFAKVQKANLDGMLKRPIYLPESLTWTLRETPSQEPRHT